MNPKSCAVPRVLTPSPPGTEGAQNRRLHGNEVLCLKVSSPWADSVWRRIFDAVVASAGIVVLSPVLLAVAALVRISSPGPAIFRQQRVGWFGRTFTILKFRTMVDVPEGCKRSSVVDPRITPIGKVLRRYKLDELPQLINVMRGDMSFIGPRPKLHGHHAPDTHFRPGLTGAATVAFASEEHLLCHIPAHELEDCHRQLITPRKLELDLAYMATSNFRSDLQLIWLTLRRQGRYLHLDEVGPWPPVQGFDRPGYPGQRVNHHIPPAAD